MAAAGERKAFVVTGSSAGVGAATALLLAKEGAGVVVNFSREAGPAEEVAQACIAAGGDALVVRADVADDAACRALAAAALGRFGRIDGLVNNAATTRFASMRKLDALSAEDFHRIYSVNLIGPYQMVRACESPLRAARGAVVNVSSIAGSMGIGSSYAYAASKGALNALTLALARSLAPEIRVNAVLPGFTETRWLKQGLGDAYDRARASYCERSALGITLQPEEVAASIVALLHASKVTGQLHTVDAGRGLGTP
ncbi:MAG TPA: SDR family oxidoreductase [Myxococcales bacterium]